MASRGPDAFATGSRGRGHGSFGLSETLLFLGVCLPVRVWIFHAVPPQHSPDSPSYLTLASALRGGSFADYTGERTLGYPALLALLDGHERWVEGVQLVGVSVMTAWLLGRLVREQAGTSAGRWALVFGLFDAYGLFFATHILTECVATLLVTLTAYLLVPLLDDHPSGKKAPWVLGLATSAAAMVRPLLAVLVVLVPMAIVLFRRRRSSTDGTGAGLCASNAWPALQTLFAALPLLGAACAFNHHLLGTYSLTTLTGYSLTQHAGGFFELADSSAEPLRRIYLKHRALKQSMTGSHSMTIWAARDEMRAATGLDHGALSRALLRVCLKLFWEHPRHYAASVWRSVVDFFLAPNARGAGVMPFPSGVWNGAEALFIGTKVGAALLALGAMVRHGKHPSRTTAFLGGQGVLLLGVALAQALVEFGESDRYSVPMQPLSLAMVLVAWTWWRAERSGQNVAGRT